MPIETFSVAKDFGIAFEYRHLERNTAVKRRRQIKGLFSIELNVVPFEFRLKSG